MLFKPWVPLGTLAFTLGWSLVDAVPVEHARSITHRLGTPDSQGLAHTNIVPGEVWVPQQHTHAKRGLRDFFKRKGRGQKGSKTELADEEADDDDFEMIDGDEDGSGYAEYQPPEPKKKKSFFSKLKKPFSRKTKEPKAGQADGPAKKPWYKSLVPSRSRADDVEIEDETPGYSEVGVNSVYGSQGQARARGATKAREAPEATSVDDGYYEEFPDEESELVRYATKRGGHRYTKPNLSKKTSRKILAQVEVSPEEY